MAIEKKLIHFNKDEDFQKENEAGNIKDTSIIFTGDEKKIYTHGEEYKTVTWKKLEKDPFNGYDYVDMGEAGIWATCNIGANSPEEYGLYFAWGETTGYINASDKSGGFTWVTTPYLEETETSIISHLDTKWSKYTATNGYSSTGKADNKLILEPEDDAAHVNMGGDWRMPTTDDFEKLINNTVPGDGANSYGWITDYKGTGVKGMLRKGKGQYADREIFFPAAGSASDDTMNLVGSTGRYWSSSLFASFDARCLNFYSSNISPKLNIPRNCGFLIRGFIPKS